MDFTGSECGIDAQTGISAFAAVSAPIGGSLTAGLDVTFADAGFETNGAVEKHAKLLAPMATAGLRGGLRLPIWGTLGTRMDVYSGVGPRFNGAALSRRAGVDLRIGSLEFAKPGRGIHDHVGARWAELVVNSSQSSPGEIEQDSAFELSAGHCVGAQALTRTS